MSKTIRLSQLNGEWIVNNQTGDNRVWTRGVYSIIHSNDIFGTGYAGWIVRQTGGVDIIGLKTNGDPWSEDIQIIWNPNASGYTSSSAENLSISSVGDTYQVTGAGISGYNGLYKLYDNPSLFNEQPVYTNDTYYLFYSSTAQKWVLGDQINNSSYAYSCDTIDGTWISEDETMAPAVVKYFPYMNVNNSNIKSGVYVDNVIGNFTDDADAQSEHIFQGYKAYVKGNLVVGSYIYYTSSSSSEQEEQSKNALLFISFNNNFNTSGDCPINIKGLTKNQYDYEQWNWNGNFTYDSTFGHVLTFPKQVDQWGYGEYTLYWINLIINGLKLSSSSYWTIEFWHKFNSDFNGTSDILFANNGGLSINYNNNGYSFSIYNYNNSTYYSGEEDWNHVALVRNRNNLLFFLNGINKTTYDFTQLNATNPGELMLGYVSSSNYKNYSIARLRISKKAKYITNFKPTIDYDQQQDGLTYYYNDIRVKNENVRFKPNEQKTYNINAVAWNGNTVSYQIISGTLPSGITFSNGVFSGTSTVQFNDTPITVRCTADGCQSINVIITLKCFASTLPVEGQVWGYYNGSILSDQNTVTATNHNVSADANGYFTLSQSNYFELDTNALRGTSAKTIIFQATLTNQGVQFIVGGSYSNCNLLSFGWGSSENKIFYHLWGTDDQAWLDLPSGSYILAFVYDNGTTTVYKDGVVLGTLNVGLDIGYDEPFYIGNYQYDDWYCGNSWQSKMYAVYDRALSQAQVASFNTLIYGSSSSSIESSSESEEQISSSSSSQSSHLVFYASLSSDVNVAQTGQSITKNGNVTYNTIDGIPCAYFDGDSYLYMNNGQNIPKQDEQRTLMAWARLMQGGLEHYVVSIGEHIRGKRYGWGFMGDNKIGRFLYLNTTYYDFAWDYDQWYHMAFTYKNGVQKLYINGQFIQQKNIQSLNTGNLGVVIGDGIDSYDDKFVGYISSVKIYDKELSSEEIIEQFNEFNISGSSSSSVEQSSSSQSEISSNSEPELAYQVSGAGSSVYNGIYRLTEYTTQNNGPVYQNENGKYLFYYGGDIGFGTWGWIISGDYSFQFDDPPAYHNNGSNITQQYYIFAGSQDAPTVTEIYLNQPVESSSSSQPSIEDISGLVFYAPLQVNNTATTGQTVTTEGEGDASATYGVVDGVQCATLNNTRFVYGTTGLPSGTQPWSMSLWAKWGGQFYGSDDVHIVFWGENGHGKSALIGVLGSTSTIYYGFHTAAYATTDVQLTTWKHLVFTFSGSVGTIYIDGQQISNFTADQYDSIQLKNFTIGGHVEANGYYFNGSIAAVRLYNKVLTNAEISLLSSEFTPSNSSSSETSSSGEPELAYQVSGAGDSECNGIYRVTSDPSIYQNENGKYLFYYAGISGWVINSQPYIQGPPYYWNHGQADSPGYNVQMGDYPAPTVTAIYV